MIGKKVLVLLILSAFFLGKDTEAKVLPQAKNVKQTGQNVRATGIGVSVKLHPNRKSLTVYFSNLHNAANVSYALTYNTSEQQEGAMGAINLTGSTDQQELLFGTCSKNVCRYHTGIKDAKLDISYTLKSGKKYLKKYKIKV